MTIDTQKWVTVREADRDEVTAPSIGDKCKRQYEALTGKKWVPAKRGEVDEAEWAEWEMLKKEDIKNDSY